MGALAGISFLAGGIVTPHSGFSPMAWVVPDASNCCWPINMIKINLSGRQTVSLPAAQALAGWVFLFWVISPKKKKA